MHVSSKENKFKEMTKQKLIILTFASVSKETRLIRQTMKQCQWGHGSSTQMCATTFLSFMHILLFKILILNIFWSDSSHAPCLPRVSPQLYSTLSSFSKTNK